MKVGSRTYINNLIQELSLSDEESRRFISLLDKRAKMPHEEFTSALQTLQVPLEKLSVTTIPADIQQMVSEFKNVGIGNIVWDPSIVRGFAYYTGMVFEVFDTSGKNNRSLFGGGRYDNLTQLFDSETLPGVGFGMGDVTLRDFLETHKLVPPYETPTELYIAISAKELAAAAQTLAGELRRQGVNVAIDFGEKKLADQIKAAAKHQIPHLIVLGPDEVASGRVKLRNLATGAEHELPRAKVARALGK